eukprot:619210-Pyramimonas_sp.AAC.1
MDVRAMASVWWGCGRERWLGVSLRRVWRMPRLGAACCPLLRVLPVGVHAPSCSRFPPRGAEHVAGA